MLLCLLLIGTLCVTALPVAATTPSSNLISAFVSGFQTRRSRNILEALLDNPVKETSPTEGITLYNRYKKVSTGTIADMAENGSLRVATIHDPQAAVAMPNGTNIAMIFIDYADTLNDNQVLQRFQECFRSLLISQNKPPQGKNVAPVRRPLIIVFTGGPVAAAQHLEYLLKEAWLLLDPEEIIGHGQTYSAIETSNLYRTFDIQIILTPHELPPPSQQAKGSMLNPAAIKAVSRAINNMALVANRTTLASISDVMNAYVNATNSSTVSAQANVTLLTSTAPIIPTEECQGMELASAAMRVSLNKALLAANNSAAGLSTFNAADPTAFASRVTQLVANATQLLQEYVIGHSTYSAGNTKNTNSTGSAAISESAVQWAQRELCHQLYVRFQPLYKRQVQTLKAVAASDFNRRVSPSELPITIHILEDLQDIQKEVLRNFTARAAMLVPTQAPATLYNAEYETFDLTQTMNEFILQREHQYRAMGVLPRGGNIGLTIELAGVKMTLPPTEVAFYLLASHPLGRDHRQDVLGMRKTDTFAISKSEQLYSEQAWKGKAWGFLKNTLRNTAMKLITSDLSKREDTQRTERATQQQAESAWVLRQKLKEKVGALEELLQKEQQHSKEGVAESLSVRRLRTTLGLRRQLHRARKDAEFAREMAMLPLSLKNPDLGGQDPETPVEAAARRKDKKVREKDLSAHELGYAYSVSTDQPATDWTRSVSQNVLINRLKNGPERFIGWDVDPLNEAKQQLDELAAQHSKTATRADRAKARSFSVGLQRGIDDYLQLVTDKIPLYGNSRYRHPEYNYGPEYDPQPHPEIYPELVDPKW